MKKRGQFTVLVVFGLLAVLAVAFALMFKASVLNASSGLTQKAVNDFVESGQVKNYVGSCLEAVSGEAMLLVMFQGGNLWKDKGQVRYNPGGNSQEAEIEADKKFDISIIGYGDLGHSKCNLTRMYYEKPEYPHPERTITELDEEPLEFRDYSPGVNPDLEPWPTCTFYEDREVGYFGVRKMKAPCTFQGVNDDAARQEVSPEVRNICRKQDYASNLPVQWQLENYTMYHLERCANLSTIERIEGIRVGVGKPSVNIAMGKTEVIVNASYSINAVGYPEEEFAAFFQHRIPVRFKELYEFFMEVVLEEVQDIGFDAREESHYEVLPSYREGFTMQNFHRADPSAVNPPHLKNPSNYNNLFLAMDGQSLIHGNPLTIYGILTNRRPVLELMEDLHYEVEEETDLNVTLTVSAKDPDDPENDADRLVFSFVASKDEGDSDEIIEFSEEIADEFTDSDPSNGGEAESEVEVDEDTRKVAKVNVTVTDSSGEIDVQKVLIVVNDPVSCGDAYVNEGAGEQCEPGDALTMTCFDENYDTGYVYTGTITCNDVGDPLECKIDQDCSEASPRRAICGDNKKKSEEECDRVGGSYRYGGKSCESELGEGYEYSGSLSCSGCDIETDSCGTATPICDDGLLVDGEYCDDPGETVESCKDHFGNDACTGNVICSDSCGPNTAAECSCPSP